MGGTGQYAEPKRLNWLSAYRHLEVRIPLAGAEVSIGSTGKDFDLVFSLSI